jgi:hypothetical protein
MTTNFVSPLSFVAVFGSGIRDPGWVKSGSGINIPDPQHCQIPRDPRWAHYIEPDLVYMDGIGSVCEHAANSLLHHLFILWRTASSLTAASTTASLQYWWALFKHV